MSPVLLIMQGVVLVVAMQTLIALIGVAYLVHWMKVREAEQRQRDRALRAAIAADVAELRTTVRAARAEAATYLEAVFTGVRGLARNLDAAREASAQAPDSPRELPQPEPDETLRLEKREEVVHLRDLAAKRRPVSR